MTQRISLKFKILYSAGIVKKNEFLNIEDDRVISISTDPLKGNEIIDYGDYTIIPGIIDIHTHGYGGMDAMECDMNQIQTWSVKLLAHGVTGFIPTSVSATSEDISKFINKFKAYMKNSSDAGAEVLGVRLEGPFISLKRSGAHRKDLIRDPAMNEIENICITGKGVVRIIDIAPELKGAKEASVYLRENGILVSLGHSDADYATAQKFLKENFNHFTHFYNAMSPFQHRDGGMVGAGLLSNNSKLEIIADLFHIHREAIEMCVRNRGWENIILITDSISATGMKDGLYDLGGLRVEMKDGKCHLENSETIAGSTLTLDKAILNLIDSGYSIENFIGSLTLNPALSLGLMDRGKLEPGLRADFCVLNGDNSVEKTYIKGRMVYSKK